MQPRVRPRQPLARSRVSVVVPCYNYGHFLPDCVRSVLDQDGVDVDVLIVDDASPDGSAAVAHELAATESTAQPRVRVLAHPTNRGHIATYNEGLAAVDGEYVVLLSADDLLAPHSLVRSVALMQAHPEVGLVYGFSPAFGDTPPPARDRVTSWSVWSGEEWLGQVCRRVSNPVATPEVVMRTALMRELVGYDARVPHAADLLLWLRAAARTAIGRVNGVDQAFYRKHGANMHVERYSGVVTDIEEKRRTFEILFEEDRPDLPGAQRLHATARRALAREALVTACQSYALDVAAGQRDKLVDLARDLDPAVDSTPAWQRYRRLAQRAGRGRGPVVPVRFSRAESARFGPGRARRIGVCA